MDRDPFDKLKPGEDMLFTEVLTVLKQGMLFHLPVSMRANVDVIHMDSGFLEEVRHLRMKLRKLSLERVLETHEYPDGWWQAVRDRWAPGWWLHRHPVRKKVVKVTEVFPEYPIDCMGRSYQAIRLGLMGLDGVERCDR